MQYLELELTKARAEVDVERDRTQSVKQELEALRAASTAALGESQRGMTAEIEDWKTQYQQCKQELDRLVDFISVKVC